MTLPDERYRAVKMARQFLLDLCSPEKTPKVPAIIRSQARGILRHYPSDWDMMQICEASPHVFQTQMEDVTKLFKQYEQTKASKDET
jgi:hypothetical protein